MKRDQSPTLSPDTPLTVGLLIELLELNENPKALLAELRKMVETSDEQTLRELEEFEKRQF